MQRPAISNRSEGAVVGGVGVAGAGAGARVDLQPARSLAERSPLRLIIMAAVLTTAVTTVADLTTQRPAITPSQVMAATTGWRTACSATGHTIPTAARSWAMTGAAILVLKRAPKRNKNPGTWPGFSF